MVATILVTQWNLIPGSVTNVFTNNVIQFNMEFRLFLNSTDMKFKLFLYS